jgi:hypothetical protein
VLPALDVNTYASGRIDVSRRLRRAIVLNDLALVKRIIKSNPDWLQNPDFDDKSNTSLHLAAEEGYADIAVRLTFNMRCCSSCLNVIVYLLAAEIPHRGRS